MQHKKEAKLIAVPVQRLHSDAILPTYAHKGDAGADIYSYYDLSISPGGRALAYTGIAFAIPDGYVGLVHPRSGLAARLGVTVLNAPGTVDSGYRGEIMVNLINHGSTTVRIRKGDRVAQIVFQTYEEAVFEEVVSFDATDRGVGGHGSTGGFSG